MKFTSSFFLIALAFFTPLAQAYVGPGAGLSAIGSIIAFLGTILLLIVGFLWYPIKRMIKGKSNDNVLEMSKEQPLAESTIEETER